MPTGSPTVASSRPRPRGAARRTALLQATLELVGERGADAVTHRAVAARAGLPLASTTYWFASKDELLTEALRHAADRDGERLRVRAAEALGGAEGRSVTPEEIVAVVLDSEACTDLGADRSAMLAAYSLIIEAARRPALQRVAEDWTRGYLEATGALLDAAGSTRPHADARLLMAATDGLLIDRLATGDVSLGDPRSELVRLLRGLLAGAAGPAGDAPAADSAGGPR